MKLVLLFLALLTSCIYDGQSDIDEHYEEDIDYEDEYEGTSSRTSKSLKKRKPSKVIDDEDYEGDYSEEYGADYGPADDEYGGEDIDFAESGLVGQRVVTDALGDITDVAAEGSSGVFGDLKSSASELQTPEQIAAQAQRGKRKVHYNASVTFKSKDPKKSIQNVVTYAQKVGAKIKRQSLTSVELDVPVKKFFNVYNYSLKQGEVVNKILSARDITAVFTDLKGRKKVLMTSKKKFEDLLKKAKNTQQRLSLLKQVQRLNEQITSINRALAKIESLATYSRIAVVAKPVTNAFVNFRPAVPKGFGWLSDLSPDDDSLADASLDIIEWDTPKNFVEVKKNNYYYAESPSKSFLRISRIKNEPKGSSDFWVKALRYAINKRPTGDIKTEKVGAFQVATISDSLFDGQYYTVAVKAEDDYIVIAEAVFPSKKDRKRFYARVKKSFARFEGGAVHAH